MGVFYSLTFKLYGTKDMQEFVDRENKSTIDKSNLLGTFIMCDLSVRILLPMYFIFSLSLELLKNA